MSLSALHRGTCKGFLLGYRDNQLLIIRNTPVLVLVLGPILCLILILALVKMSLIPGTDDIGKRCKIEQESEGKVSMVLKYFSTRE